MVQAAESALVDPLEPAILRRLQRERSIRRAEAAALELGKTARWVGDIAHLDWRILLGDLSRAPLEMLVFELDGASVAVQRRGLIQFRKVARRLPGLRAELDRDSLRFRWRGGRGGLHLHSRLPAASEPDTLHVVLTRPVSQRRDGWVRDVLADVTASLGAP